MIERDRLICQMRDEGHSYEEIADKLQSRGFDLTVRGVQSAWKRRSRNAAPIQSRSSYRAILDSTPPRPTVKDPDAYMARKKVRFEDETRFSRPAHISEALGRVLERAARNMGE